MSTEGTKERELYEIRLQSAQKWRELGGNPFGNGFRPSHLAAHILAAHDKHSDAELAKAASYQVAARVVGHRSFGKAAFTHVQDRSGSIQLHVKKDALGDAAYALFKEVQLGDFVGAEGTIFRSKTGELTLSVTKLVPLTKALRAPPGKFV